MKNVMLIKTRFPIIERAFWNCETRGNYLPAPARTATRARPCEESNRRSRPPGSIAIVEVISRRIVEIHSALGKTKSKHLSVKIDIALRIAGDRSDMVNAVEFH